MPTVRTVVVAASGGDYTSLFSAEAGEQANMVTLDRQLDISHQLAGDTTAVTFSGSTTDATRYIRVFAPTGWRHSGVWDASKSHFSTTGQIPLRGDDAYIRYEGLQVKFTGSSGFVRLVYSNGPDNSEHVIDSCILWAAPTAALSSLDGVQAVFASSGTNRVVKISNTLFIDINDGASHGTAISCQSSRTLYANNNTIVGAVLGMSRSAGTFTAKNNLFRSCTTAASGTFANGTDANATDLGSMGYTVTGGGNVNDRVSQTFTFVNEAGDNFQLTAADAGAKGHGLDLSADANLPVTLDITGASRTTPYDIGAFRFASSFNPAWASRATQLIGVSCA